MGSDGVRRGRKAAAQRGSTGALEFRDEAGKTLCIENAETLHGRYLAHCALHGITPVDVTAF